MGLERRGNGLYYYRKRREGQRVVSEYVGHGEVVLMLEALGASERRADRARERTQRSEIEQVDLAINELGEIAQMVARAMLLVNGCHTHKGQWRRCKNKTFKK